MFTKSEETLVITSCLPILFPEESPSHHSAICCSCSYHFLAVATFLSVFLLTDEEFGTCMIVRF